uniref:Uncharacterized protein n=1 Tax=Arundo donax TaxID=35708 RepID=A0A0A9B2L7_ARUDO
MVKLNKISSSRLPRDSRKLRIMNTLNVTLKCFSATKP